MVQQKLNYIAGAGTKNVKNGSGRSGISRYLYAVLEILFGEIKINNSGILVGYSMCKAVETSSTTLRVEGGGV